MENVGDQNKKVNLEDLPKEELVKRCKNLLAIAQKAKSAKDNLQEELNNLKSQHLNKEEKNSASQEIIENLTQQKLTLITTIEELKHKNSYFENQLKQAQEIVEKHNQLENENVAFKRQNKRLTDENEQLISDLESLEKQIEELKQLGLEQQTQLLALEKNKVLADEKKSNDDIGKINELQSMLSISLEEVKKLHAENKVSLEKIEDLKVNLSEKDKNILTISQELESKCDIIKALTCELESLKLYKVETSNVIVNYDKLKLDYESIKNSVHSVSDENLLELNNKLKEKLKFYHSKLVKFATQIKELKNDKKEILRLFMLYTDQVKIWRDQLNIVVSKLSQVEVEFENEKRMLNEENVSFLNQLKTIIKLREEDEETKEKLEKENSDLKCEKELLNSRLKQYEELQSQGVDEISNYEKEIALLKQTLLKLETQNKDFQQSQESTKLELESLLSEKKEKILKLETDLTLVQDEKELDYRKISILQEKVDHLEQELDHSKATETQLAEKSSEEILKLVQENKDLLKLNGRIQEELDNINLVKSQSIDDESQTEGDIIPNNEYEEQIINLKRENGELLREMNEMNQALKERGETISKLEAHCEEVMKKLQFYETQANKNVDNISQKDEIIKKLTKEIDNLQKNISSNDNDYKETEINSLKNEIELLKERLNANMDSSYAESETMSTSTISRTEEVNRLKDLEGSWEERYGKLRNLAVKLKGKIRELTATITKEQQEKEELQKKLAQNLKTIQTLQTQSDKLEDELENNKKQTNQYVARLNTIAEEISKDKQLLVSNEETISKLKQELDQHKNEKQATETWKKQVSAKVQLLRKELEANNLLKKDFEAKIAKLNTDLEAKEQQLQKEIESHKQTRSLLDQSNNECKKNSVLNLEMQDYERSAKELSQKIDKKQDHITKLKNQVESLKSTINALREQNKILEEKLHNDESTLSSASTEISSYKKKLSEIENLIQQKDDKIRSVTELLESSRSENEELSTELSKVIAEHQKSINSVKSEKDHLRSQVLGLQQSLRQTQDILKLKEDELKSVSSEYEGYKVRAQSVLRQNQNRDVGLEEKLTEEVTSLKSQNNLLNTQLKELIDKTTNLEKSCEKLSSEKDEILRKYHESEVEVEDLKNQFAQLSSQHQKTINEHAETVRSLKVHADTLSQCYRQQLSEQEVRHNREIIELQSKLEKAPSPSEPPLPLPPSMPREEGEGSESVESSNTMNIQHPVPLERLLGTDMDQEMQSLKKQLADQESKVGYLTALLSDTEQDLAKHVQMNKMLKEEIRRQQRSVEREKHAENLEYLKNVVFKFVTLNSGDERTRLVPVLNTILKLSPEETQKLSLVARGEPGLRGWTNYLPTWTTPTKPQ